MQIVHQGTCNTVNCLHFGGGNEDCLQKFQELEGILGKNILDIKNYKLKVRLYFHVYHNLLQFKYFKLIFGYL